MLYNLIGDIHGRDAWRQLVRKDAVNIFMGDYFDPYRKPRPMPSSCEALTNLKYIIAYKKAFPETILLLGNHDLHYLWDEHYLRYNPKWSKNYGDLIRDNWNLFQAAFSIGKRILVTHAGVTQPWCELAGIPKGLSVRELADAINQRMNDEQQRHIFTAQFSMASDDKQGVSPSASPIWVRPETLRTHAHLLNSDGKEIIQIVGHTQIEAVTLEPPFFFVDCLGYITQSLLVEYSDQGGYDFAEYEPKSFNDQFCNL
jgi:hypothetical protein